MLSNAHFLAKFRFGTSENEPAKILQNFAKSMLILLTLTRKRALLPQIPCISALHRVAFFADVVSIVGQGLYVEGSKLAGPAAMKECAGTVTFSFVVRSR